MTDALTSRIITELRASREALVGISKDELTGEAINAWFTQNHTILTRADTVTHENLHFAPRWIMAGFWQEEDHDVVLELRNRIIEAIEQSLYLIDREQRVRPVLDEYILKISDTKLATLLREFNTLRTSEPNMAGIGFRTILPLIIRQRAKRVDPAHRLATKEDIEFEPDIKAAIAHGSLFSDAESRLLRAYLQHGSKASFDNVAHKSHYLIDKDELEAAVNLLNRLLPTIVD